jgi:hypothetical protein
VEIEGIPNEPFNVQAQLSKFVGLGGEALSCGTCLSSRHLGAAEACPVSTMDDLARLSEEADRVITFG